ncbi:MAG: SAM-dependent chlorinase/fluorinase [Chromatiaceae bacterium]|nr:SAM-dependent chlorinase/fluorinase [Chromatiaceae bacterium]
MHIALIKRIALITDFGAGPYIGQVQARLHALLPAVPSIDLVHDLPPFRPDLAALLLPALVRDLPANTLNLCVVDPGVGGTRAGLVARVGEQWCIGPDNGLLAPLLRTVENSEVWRIGWQPERTSASFHGRDWFAPSAARLCQGEPLHLAPLSVDALVGADWPPERAVILYVDRYGNLMTGLRPPANPASYRLKLGGQQLSWARTFCERPQGEPFWYENALGLVEIAVNQGRADTLFGLQPGDCITGWA